MSKEEYEKVLRPLMVFSNKNMSVKNKYEFLDILKCVIDDTYQSGFENGYSAAANRAIKVIDNEFKL